ncbi:MAG: 3-keto-disaccharide hydrolase [Thermoguttaceae bacterium]
MRSTVMFWTLAAAAILIASSLSGAEKGNTGPKESVDLFDGKSLQGWTCFLVEDGAKMEDVWSVKDGILICKGEPHGFLATEKCYQDFNLVVEWRWAPGKEPGNSGVLMRITGEKKMLPNCMEAQLKSGDAGALYGFQGFKIDGPSERKSETKGHQLGGDLTGLKKLAATEKEPGQWNRYDITLKGDRVVIKVNGTQVNEAHGCEIRCGQIGLQSEGGEIHFRKVLLHPLD